MNSNKNSLSEEGPSDLFCVPLIINDAEIPTDSKFEDFLES